MEPFSLDALLLPLAAFFARFLADPADDVARRFTPEAGEELLPLVAGDIEFTQFLAVLRWK